MKCPKCGYLRLPSEMAFTPATECPACGIVYSKYESNAAEPENSLIKKPSPVHEITLKTARERVELRLRKSAARRQTDQRSKTLQLARQLAAEGVRKRREEWKRSQAAFASTSEHLEGPAPDADLTPAQGTAARWPGLEEAAHPQAARGDAIPGPASPASAVVLSWPADKRAAAASPPGEGADPHPAPEARPTGAAQSAEGLSEIGLARAADAAPADRPNTCAPLYPRSTSDARARRAWPHRAGGGQRLWSMAAWLMLVVGALGAVLSWATFYAKGDLVHSAWPGGAAPVALLLGFAYLTLGLFGFAFLWLEAVIDRRLTDIHRLLLARQSERRAEEEDGDD